MAPSRQHERSGFRGGELSPCRMMGVSVGTHALALLLLLALALALFADVLFFQRDLVPAQTLTDIHISFGPFRAFGFGALAQGRLALWNPYAFSGYPFLGGFQAALLYPPNAIFLLLPLTAALNWSILGHVVFGGAAFYFWALARRLHPWASLAGAALYMFCGANFLHVYAGHLTIICLSAWVPLLFLALDGCIRRPRLGWVLLGSLCSAMMALAGHPQYLFYTALAAGAYALLHLRRHRRRGRYLLCLLGIALGGAALSAVQLLTGWDAARESVRAGGASLDFVSIFSFPPENLLTLLSPACLGGDSHLAYWGRYAMWEMVIYFSVTGLVMAIYGAVCGRPRARRHLALLALLFLLLALGRHTPLLKILYRWVPGFQSFRGLSKFVFQATLFMIMLSAVGFDRFLRRGPRRRWGAWLLLGTAFLLALAGFGIRLAAAHPSGGAWAGLMSSLRKTGDVYLPAEIMQAPVFIQRAARHASSGLWLAALILLVLSGLFLLRRHTRRAAGWAGVLALIEMILFASAFRASFDMQALHDARVERQLRADPGDYRVLGANPSAGMMLGYRDLWGIDPFMLKRYAEFIAVTQGLPADKAEAVWIFLNYHPAFRMLRCKYTVDPQGKLQPVPPSAAPLPHLSLLTAYALEQNRDVRLKRLLDPAFDPRRLVLLESEPQSTPAALPAGQASPGQARVIEESVNGLVIEAELTTPALLLITDAYSKDWQARPLAGSSQRSYRIMPADHCLQAIPLAAGRHRISLAYRPFWFVLGCVISVAAAGAWCALAGWLIFRRPSPATSPAA